MPLRPTTWFACCLPLASVQAAGLDDAPGPVARTGCSAFVIGPCASHRAARPAPAAAGADVPRTAAPRAPPAPPAVSEPADADVERYLAGHGRPPREVARALLDPSDANIAAMMRRLQRDQAIAAYVGQRMTELAQADP